MPSACPAQCISSAAALLVNRRGVHSFIHAFVARKFGGDALKITSFTGSSAALNAVASEFTAKAPHETALAGEDVFSIPLSPPT
jgi:hypothetical protein